MHHIDKVIANGKHVTPSTEVLLNPFAWRYRKPHVRVPSAMACDGVMESSTLMFGPLFGE
jgi:hypothetical protein